jgi:hypothetical protein
MYPGIPSSEHAQHDRQAGLNLCYERSAKSSYTAAYFQ